mgnify:CR=1 FL=1
MAEETAGWVLREMQSSDGGYFSSLDADSEHEEGKFYVWQRKEVRQLLNTEEWAVAEPYYGLDSTPNFEHRDWNLRVSASLADIAQCLGISTEQAGVLVKNGLTSLAALLQADETDLLGIPEIGDQAGAILQAAREEQARRALKVGETSPA